MNKKELNKFKKESEKEVYTALSLLILASTKRCVDETSKQFKYKMGKKTILMNWYIAFFLYHVLIYLNVLKPELIPIDREDFKHALYLRLLRDFRFDTDKVWEVWGKLDEDGYEQNHPQTFATAIMDDISLKSLNAQMELMDYLGAYNTQILYKGIDKVFSELEIKK